jgi:hypothetical protein
MGEEGGGNLGKELYKERTSRGRPKPKIAGGDDGWERERGERGSKKRKNKKGPIEPVYRRRAPAGI